MKKRLNILSVRSAWSMLRLRICGIWQNLLTSAEVMTNQKCHLGCRDAMPVKTTQGLMHKATLVYFL